MSGTLIFAENCPYSLEVINFIREHPVIIPFVKTHNINKQGVPNGVTRVPMIVTSSGEKHVGIEVLRWLENLVPVTFEGSESKVGYSFDEPFDGVGDSFPLDAYGISLSPPITKELNDRINKPLNEAYADIKKKHGS